MLMGDLKGEQFQSFTGISSETLTKYERWKQLLTRWNNKINLISKNTEFDFWSRHALDSFQVLKFVPDQAKSCIDLGSGAGFPGLALAIGLRDRVGAEVSLVESNGKKCNFLRTVKRELELPVKVYQARAEDVPPIPYDVVSARAFAPLPKLLEYALQFWGPTTIGIFPKGVSWEDEIKDAQKNWSFSVESVESETDAEARILLIKNLTRKPGVAKLGEKN